MLRYRLIVYERGKARALAHSQDIEVVHAHAERVIPDEHWDIYGKTFVIRRSRKRQKVMDRRAKRITAYSKNVRQRSYSDRVIRSLREPRRSLWRRIFQ